MEKPDIVALPTSQMQALCDVLGLGKEVQDNPESMIVALEGADFSKIFYAKPTEDGPRLEGTIGFKFDQVESSIVKARMKKLGR